MIHLFTRYFDDGHGSMNFPKQETWAEQQNLQYVENFGYKGSRFLINLPPENKENSTGSGIS